MYSTSCSDLGLEQMIKTLGSTVLRLILRALGHSETLRYHKLYYYNNHISTWNSYLILNLLCTFANHSYPQLPKVLVLQCS